MKVIIKGVLLAITCVSLLFAVSSFSAPPTNSQILLYKGKVIGTYTGYQRDATCQAGKGQLYFCYSVGDLLPAKGVTARMGTHKGYFHTNLHLTITTKGGPKTITIPCYHSPQMGGVIAAWKNVGGNGYQCQGW